MGEPNNAGLAAAVAGGYLLGRAKQGRMALTAAAVLLGRGVRPRDLVAGGVRRISGAPDGGEESGKIRHTIAQTARTTASEAANRRVTALADALHKRTLGLSGAEESGAEESGADAAGDTHDEAEPDRGGTSAGVRHDDGEKPGPPKKRKAAAGRPAPAKRSAPAKRRASAEPSAPAGRGSRKPAPRTRRER